MRNLPITTHTSAGFADRDALTLFLVLTTFFLYLQAQLLRNTPRQLILSFLSGVTMGIVGLTWPGVGFPISVIVFTNWFTLLLGHFDKKQCLLYVAWFTPIAFLITIFTPHYRHLANPFAVLALLFPLGFLVFGCIWVLFQRHINLLQADRYLPLLTSPLVLSGAYLLSLSIMTCFAVGPMTFSNWILSFQTELFNPLGIPLMKSVAELQSPTWWDWWGSFGLFLLFAHIGAAIILMKAISAFYMRPKSLMMLFLLVLVVLTLMPPKAPTFHEFPVFLQWFPLLAIVSLLFVASWLHWKHYPQIKLETHQNWRHIYSWLFCLCWFIGSFLATRTASRFALFFTPIALLTASLCIVKIVHLIAPRTLRQTAFQSLILALIAWGFVIIRPGVLNCLFNFVGFKPLSKASAIAAFWTYFILNALVVVFLLYRSTVRLISTCSDRKIVRAVGWITVCLIVFLAFGGAWGSPGLLQNGYRLAQQISPGLTPVWTRGLAWLKTYTNLDSVIAAWWDYGAWINELGRRTTIVDEDHQFPNWIAWMARNVFCAHSDIEALEFLKTREATHLLLTSEEIQKLWHISTVGSNSDLDRQSLVIPLAIQSIEVNRDQNTARLNFAPIYIPTEQEPNLEGKTRKKKRTMKTQLAVSFEIHHGRPVPREISATFADDLKFSLKRAIVNHEDYLFSKGETESGLLLDFPPLKTVDDIANYAQQIRAFYIPERAQRQLYVRLFLFNEKIPHFEPAYPLLNFSNAPIKIWRLSYPEQITLRPKYLSTE